MLIKDRRLVVHDNPKPGADHISVPKSKMYYAKFIKISSCRLHHTRRQPEDNALWRPWSSWHP